MDFYPYGLKELKKVTSSNSSLWIVQIKKIEFFNINTAENLTIDNMYRGKVIREEKLLEFNAEGSGYFYVEFEEGQKIEFWSNEYVVDA